jgi:hypothetical protein
MYDYCIHTDLICVAAKDIKHTTGSNGTQAVLIPNQGLSLRRHIAWLNLQLTCRFVATEIRSYMTETSFLNDKNNRTYELDLDVYCNFPPAKSIRPVVWRSLPCAPDKVDIVIINVAAREGPGPWTEGGAASLARALYQLLNQLLHKGPRLVAGKRLSNNMRLSELVINVDIGMERSPPELGCNTQPSYNFRTLMSGWEQISRTGALVNFLERTRLCSTGELAIEKEIVVEYKTVPLIPGFWRGYGFEWGV